jgi:alpha-N-arabinofuranosidase
MLYRRSPTDAWAKAGDYHAIAPPAFLGFMGKTFGDGEDVVFDADYAAVEELPEPEGEAAAEAPAVLTVARDHPWPLDERRFSHFVEHMARCIYGGLWAEKLNNRKFGATASKGVVEIWHPAGDAKATYAADVGEFYCPAQSQRIELSGPSEAGVAQGPMGVRGDVAHQGCVIVRARPGGLKLRVGLWAEGRCLAEAALGPVGEKWAKLVFTLPPIGQTTAAEFRILASGPGKVWLGAASLMPADNLDGWRRDVVEAMRAIRPAAIRWPGGNFASQYDWREGIGDRDRRPVRWNRAWQCWEWNDVGTDEFLRLCGILGAEPYICANAGEGTPHQAAEWVQYCNGPASSPMGRLRAANGHPKPYGVKLWGLGNEMYGSWQAGWLDGDRYGLKAAQMASAMAAVTGPLQTVLVGTEGHTSDDFTARAVRIAGPYSNYVSVHYYTSVDVNGDALAGYGVAVSLPLYVERMLAEAWDIVRAANGGKPLPISFDEWNVWHVENDFAPGYRGFYSLREGLFAGEVMNVLNRLGPKAPIACITQSVNVLGLLRVNDTAVVATPSYWVIKLFRDRAGREGLPVAYEGPTADLFSGSTPALDSTCTWDASTGRLSVFLVNRKVHRAATARIRVPWADSLALAGVEAVAADDYLVANDYAHPDAVRARKTPELGKAVGEREVEVTVPPHSVVAVDLKVGR